MRKKPQGKSGPIKVGGTVEWEITYLPDDKAEREQLIAGLFVNAFEGWVAMESEPSLRPFGPPTQNPENDLDFTVSTGLGGKLMELAEFAPLAEGGYQNAPKSLPVKEKAALAGALVQKKSAHQGGAGRFLVLYVTEHGFWLDPIAIEWMRRRLHATPPNFERVYYLSIHSLTEASASEIYPGQPHHYFGEFSDAQLSSIGVHTPHPTELIRGASFAWKATVLYGRVHLMANFRLDFTQTGAFVGF